VFRPSDKASGTMHDLPQGAGQPNSAASHRSRSSSESSSTSALAELTGGQRRSIPSLSLTDSGPLSDLEKSAALVFSKILKGLTSTESAGGSVSLDSDEMLVRDAARMRARRRLFHAFNELFHHVLWSRDERAGKQLASDWGREVQGSAAHRLHAERVGVRKDQGFAGGGRKVEDRMQAMQSKIAEMSTMLDGLLLVCPYCKVQNIDHVSLRAHGAACTFNPDVAFIFWQQPCS